jgi:hypothetical protein
MLDQNPIDLESWNYRNNPLKYIDPLGLDYIDVENEIQKSAFSDREEYAAQYNRPSSCSE